MFGSIGKAMGGVFGGGGKFNPMNTMPGLKQVGQSLGMGQQQKPQGIGPSQPAMGGFMQQMKGGHPPNQMNNMAQGMGNMASSMGMGGPKPPMEAQQPPQMGEGLAPSMNAMSQMMQQPPNQPPAAAGPMPEFGMQQEGRLPQEMRDTGFTNHAYGGPYGQRM